VAICGDWGSIALREAFAKGDREPHNGAMWPFSKERTYLDYASATPLLPEAAARMREAEKYIGNPGGIHAEAVEAKHALQDARERIAKILGCKARELVFTSGLTESNNLAIVGYARNLERVKRTLSGTHWIVSAIEHASVLESFSEIERLGGSVTHLVPNEKGIFTPEILRTALRQETVFVSIGWANNEIGVVQQLGALTEVAHAYEKEHGSRIIMHSDAGQAPLYEPTVVHSLGVDLLSLSASKLYGPHGVGALYISNRVNLAPIVLGGDQERALRAGTENVALAVGFAAAFEVVAHERHAEAKRLQKMRDDLAREIIAQIPGSIINGDTKHALPHMLNISIPHVDSEYLTLQLDHTGFAVSTKSACQEGEKASHVIEALGGGPERAEHTLRISLGRKTSQHEIEDFLRALTKRAKIVH